MNHLRPIKISVFASLFAMVFSSCTPSVDMPKGNSSKYASARLAILENTNGVPDEMKAVHPMIHRSLQKEFTRNGLSFGSQNSDLIIGYMVLVQEPGMTQQYASYFGNGRDGDKVRHVAHLKGAVDNGRPDFFQRAGIIIDVIDAKTNKLIYRDFAAGDMVKGISGSARQARIDAAVTEALNGFFK